MMRKARRIKSTFAPHVKQRLGWEDGNGHWYSTGPNKINKLIAIVEHDVALARLTAFMNAKEQCVADHLYASAWDMLQARP